MVNRTKRTLRLEFTPQFYRNNEGYDLRMWRYRKFEKILHWLLPKLRIGEFHRSVTLRSRKNLIVISRYEDTENSDSMYYEKNIYFSKHFAESFKQCSKYGGYKKIGTKYYWSHRKLNYFDFKKNIYGGLPQFITGARLVKFERVHYIPHRWNSNLSNKYTFIASPSKGDNFEINKAFSFNIGMVEWFQHFIQDCLPILSHSRSFLIENPDIKLIFPKSSSNLANRDFYLHKLGIFNEVIETEVNDQFNIENLFYWDFIPYNAKFILPYKWHRQLRDFYNTTLLNDQNRTLILFTRNEKSRNIENIEALHQNLKEIAEKSNLILKVINTSAMRFYDYIEDIMKSKIILGVHGGASYNILFAPNDCHFFEIIPTNGTDSVIKFASGIGIQYHPIPINFSKSDLALSLSDVDLSNLNREIYSIT